MKKMIYAPVAIPTLNRIEHLKRCIGSLQRNPLAKYTELYISVDYPPANGKYREGYEEVKEFVGSIEGFLGVKTFFQSDNLGPSGNSAFLFDRIDEDGYDRYIFTEDDNEFSPNFLEYMDKGLMKWQDSDTVYAICSRGTFCLDKKMLTGNYYVRRDYSPYGVGFWIAKKKEALGTLTQSYLDDLVESKEKRSKLFRNRPGTYQSLSMDLIGEYPAMRGADGKLHATIDSVTNIYCTIENKYCIYPLINKVRNWGRDGSGVNSPDNKGLNVSEEELDSDTGFDYVTDRDLMRISSLNIRESTAKERPHVKSLIRAWLVVTGKRLLRPEDFEIYMRIVKKAGRIL
jgi:hypothetical protein